MAKGRYKLTSIVKILLAEGQLKLFLTSTIFSRDSWPKANENLTFSSGDTFGLRPTETFSARLSLVENISLVEIIVALTAYSREYLGQRPMETEHSLVEILLAKGQLKLFLALTTFSREYFGQRLDSIRFFWTKVN